MKRTIRSAFTLVELLVVITIIGILMGLLIPAVNSAREAARRNQCSVNIKNLALAAVQHENSKGHLPYYLQKFGYFGAAGATTVADPSDPGADNVAGHVKLGGFGVAILPWLEAQPTYEHWTEDRYPVIHDGGAAAELSASASVGVSSAGEGFHPLAGPNLAIFQCPSNPNVNGDQGANSYVSNNGLSYFRTTTSAGVTTTARLADSAGTTIVPLSEVQSKNNGTSFFGYREAVNATSSPFAGPTKISLDDLKDGQGFTALYSENVQALPWYLPGFFNGSDLENTAGEDLNMVAADFTRLLSGAYTAGMVWHLEDPDPSFLSPLGLNPHQFDSSGTYSAAVVQVNEKHRINGRGTSVSEDIFVEQMDQNNYVNLARPSAAHVEGVNMGFADGATRFIVESIDYRVYQAIMTPRGKSSDVPWPEFTLTDEIAL